MTMSNSEQLPDPPAQWDIDSHLPQLEEKSQSATQEHLILALDHVGAQLDAHGFSWALMGGLALFMHGNQNRDTLDVDVAVDARPKDIIAALRGNRCGSCLRLFFFFSSSSSSFSSFSFYLLLCLLILFFRSVCWACIYSI